MRIYPAQLAKIKITEPFDPDSVKTYGFTLKPELWTLNTVYEKDYNVVRPTVHNGFQYEIVSNGKSGATEPTWSTTEDEEFTDGTVTYKAKRYNAFLRPDKTLNTIDSVWSATNLVPLTSPTYTAEGKATVQIGPVPAGVTSFEVTLQAKDVDGNIEDLTFVFSKVKDR